MRNINISNELATKVPDLQLACILCDVHPVQVHAQLWNEILVKIQEISSTTSLEQISQIPAIAASRKAYKACGKDPARYRLSAEALLRRVVNRNELTMLIRSTVMWLLESETTANRTSELAAVN